MEGRQPQKQQSIPTALSFVPHASAMLLMHTDLATLWHVAQRSLNQTALKACMSCAYVPRWCAWFPPPYKLLDLFVAPSPLENAAPPPQRLSHACTA